MIIIEATETSKSLCNFIALLTSLIEATYHHTIGINKIITLIDSHFNYLLCMFNLVVRLKEWVQCKFIVPQPSWVYRKLNWFFTSNLLL